MKNKFTAILDIYSCIMQVTFCFKRCWNRKMSKTHEIEAKEKKI